MTYHREYPHLEFKETWRLDKRPLIVLGQCISLIQAISNTPVLPDYYEELMTVALKKGAQATTAIEGNTLTDEEIEKLQAGEKLPASKEYQEIEVRNILDAFNVLLLETIYDKKTQLISKDLLLRFHRLVGKGLGEHFSAIPGHFREADAVVGTYRCPDYRDVPALIDKYCEWLREQFKFEDGKQLFSDVIIQAIVAHVYLEWIHPFGDGNGRTGRLVEFYILSRGGNPDITLHILSNHYNLTRPEYYRHLDNAAKTKNLSAFIEYALVGFRDGLKQTLGKMQNSLVKITWQRFVYDTFENIEMKQKEVFKRRRRLALEIPLDTQFLAKDIPDLNIKLAKLYSNVSAKTIERDIEELKSHNIIIKKDGYYIAITTSVSRMMARRISN